MAKKVNKNINIETVKLDSKSASRFDVEFPVDHAQKIIQMQNQSGKGDWKLSKGQNLKIQDGKIVSTANSTSSKE